MKRIVNTLCTGLVLAGLASQATAAASAAGGNPYEVVVDRNVFDLKPLIAPPPPENTLQANAAKIELQGITDGIIKGKRQALVTILEQPKPGEQAKPRGLIMDEGERRGVVTVKAINPEARTVTFDNAGKEETLKLTNAPAKLAAMSGAPVSGPMPAMPQPAFAPLPRPAVPQPAYALPKPAANVIQRPLRVATSAGGGEPVGGVPAVATPKPPQLTAEEQTILIEVERERTKEATARGELPPLPPTELTPPGSTGLPPAPPLPGK